VLSAVFSDEGPGIIPRRQLPAQPSRSRIGPFSQPGCVIFVKLNQFAEGDMSTVRLLPQAQVVLAGP